eukprot:CAMPEP_0175250566 /NCGR_PEP_ID=MMETSP0093-20121207/35219_1 /TAXON_ID=311494 /ORGANISM="Alexandrium monilatum, Strain CCMP3105" /LENGTH=33 /DNA_ID= /DNA_START= /DNA_END= /DNA_ORIENTATION=
MTPKGGAKEKGGTKPNDHQLSWNGTRAAARVIH